MNISTGRRNGKTLEMLKQAMKENELLGKALENARQEIATLKSENKKKKEQLEKCVKVEKVEALIRRNTKNTISLTIWGCKEVIDICKDSEGKVYAETLKKAIDRLKESEDKK